MFSLVLGAAACGLVVGNLTRLLVRQDEGNWPMTTVTVARERLRRGQALSLDVTRARELRQNLTTASVVGAADRESVVGRQLLVDVEEGEVLRWWFFEPGPGAEPSNRAEACSQLTRRSR